MVMKVLIIYPNLPLMSLPSIAVGIFNAILKKNDCDIKLFDTRIYGKNSSNRHLKLEKIGAVSEAEDSGRDLFSKDQAFMEDDLKDLVKSFKPDIILLSVMEDVWTITKKLLKSIKEFNVPIIAGGVFVMAAPEIVIADENIDIICTYEGELVLSNIIKAWKEKRSFDDIKGIWFKRSGEVVKNPPEKLCDISEVTPDFDCFDVNLTKRSMGGKTFKRVLTMETYRGCPYNCAYCGSPGIKKHATKLKIGNFLRRKNIFSVKRDIELYLKTYKPDIIMFQDDSFLARPKEELFFFAEMIKEHKIPFWFNSRIENCDLDVLLALKDAGLYRMTFGIESGNENYRMDILHRNVSTDTYLKYFNYINESNVPYSLNAIIGMPFETRDMILDTARLIGASRGYDSIMISKYQVYHDTELRDVAVKNNFIPRNFINSENLTDVGGGFMSEWQVNMPYPYLQPDDVERLVKTFALYAYFPDWRWPEIKLAETDDVLYNKLMEEYKSAFFVDHQLGGMDRIKMRYHK